MLNIRSKIYFNEHWDKTMVIRHKVQVVLATIIIIIKMKRKQGQVEKKENFVNSIYYVYVSFETESTRKTRPNKSG